MEVVTPVVFGDPQIMVDWGVHVSLGRDSRLIDGIGEA